MKKFVLFGCILGLLAYTVEVSAASSMSLITKERIEASKTVKDSKLKNWINTHTKFMVGEMDNIQDNDFGDEYTASYYDYGDGKAYKAELLSDLRSFLKDMSSGVYTTRLTRSEINTVESGVLAYQKDLLRSYVKMLERQTSQDQKVSSNTYFTLKSKDASVEVSLAPYNVVVSRDQKNIELDLKLSGKVSTSTGESMFSSGSFVFDVHFKLVDTNMYITLKNYSLDFPDMELSLADAREELEKIVGKTILIDTDSLDIPVEEIQASIMDGEETTNIIKKVLAVLQTNSLLTPFARGADTYVLSVKKTTILKLYKAMGITSNVNYFSRDIEEFFEGVILTYSKDGSINLKKRENDTMTDIRLSRDTAGSPVFALDMKSRGLAYQNHVGFTATPLTASLKVDVEEFFMTIDWTPAKLVGLIKSGATEVATMNAEKIAEGNWKFELNAKMSEYFSLPVEGTGSENNIMARLWGDYKQEFGTFSIVAPTEFTLLSELE